MKNAIRFVLSSSSGQSLVELALTVPLLFLLSIGTAELARIAYYSIVTENAAHAGALYASQNTVTASDTPGITATANSEAANIGGGSTLTVTSIGHVCTCFDPISGVNSSMATCYSACPSPDTILQYVQVNTDAVANTLFHYPGLAGNTFTVYGSATVPVGR